jgi:hypothetical protein
MYAEGSAQQVRYEFKGRYGAAVPSIPLPTEASHDEVDAFVKQILGLLNEDKKPILTR